MEAPFTTRKPEGQGTTHTGERMDMARDFDRGVATDRRQVASSATKVALPNKPDGATQGPSVVSQYIAETQHITNAYNF
jgi:hypothetical protein